MKRLFKQQKEKIALTKIQHKRVTDRQICLSNEQNLYIQDPFWIDKSDSMLIACAGSGKTKSMIEKMKFLASQGLFNKKQMMVFSYSKLTIEHTKNCFKQYAECSIFSDDKLIKTIDAFCYDILQKLDPSNETCAVQVLSSKFVSMMQKEPEKLKKRIKSSKYGKIQVLFVDEAQDLNDVQYQIILFMKQITGCVIHLIGDPNQNIYQFRGSFEKYMLNHSAKVFKLTKNFRCDPTIEQFSNYFKYYNHTDDNTQDPLICDSPSQTKKNIEIYVGSYNENDDYILGIIKDLRAEGYKYNNIAILSPIVGDQFNSGIKRIANMFDRKNIPYVPYYSEIKDEQQKKIKTKSKKDGVNLLTIHGSKGLEYSVIILIKLQDKMMYQDQLEQQHFVSQNMNLIYVALTRAMDKLIIIHDDQQNIQHKHICSIMQCIPSDLYSGYGDINKHLDTIQVKINKRQLIYDENMQFLQNHTINNKKDILLITKRLMPELFNITQKEVMYQNSLFNWKTSVTRFIQNISQGDLLDILDNFMYKKKCEELYVISDQQQNLFKTIRVDHEAFVGILFEQVIFYQIQWKKIQEFKSNALKQDYQADTQSEGSLEIPKTPQILGIVFSLKDQIRKQNTTVQINEFFVVYEYEQLQEILIIYNNIKQNETITQKEADQIFSEYSKKCVMRSKVDTLSINLYVETLDFQTICSGQMQQLELNGKQLFEHIDKYNQNLNWVDSLDSIIYISMIKSAIKSKHSKYINHDLTFIKRMTEFKPLFENLDNTVSESLSKESIQYQYEVGTDDIIGFIDFLVIGQSENTIIELKVTNETSTEHILQVLLYDFLIEMDRQQELNNRLIIINALKGVQYEILFEKKDELYKYLGELLNQDYQKRCQFSC